MSKNSFKSKHILRHVINAIDQKYSDGDVGDDDDDVGNDDDDDDDVDGGIRNIHSAFANFPKVKNIWNRSDHELLFRS